MLETAANNEKENRTDFTRMSVEKATELSKTIKPLTVVNDELFGEILASCASDHVALGDFYNNPRILEGDPSITLRKVDTIETAHIPLPNITNGTELNPFQPRIQDLLSQIPEDRLDMISGYHISDYKFDDVQKCYIATVDLYEDTKKFAQYKDNEVQISTKELDHRVANIRQVYTNKSCLLYTSPSPRD